jgi:hypothetical protein
MKRGYSKVTYWGIIINDIILRKKETEFGRGVDIKLTGDEVAAMIDAYLAVVYRLVDQEQ